MSDNAFTYGNLILLYCNFNRDDGPNGEIIDESADNTVHESLPDFVTGRIALCIQTFDIIMKSKPDKFNTSVILISKNEYTRVIADRLIAGGISEQYLENDNSSKTIEAVINNVLFKITNLTNPPTIYFIGSVWQKEVFDSIAYASKLCAAQTPLRKFETKKCLDFAMLFKCPHNLLLTLGLAAVLEFYIVQPTTLAQLKNY